MVGRPKLACVMITKNAGVRFSQCLASVDWVDELVILDSGSTDNTIELARKAGAKVYQSQDWPGFGPQRQQAQTFVSADWILWVDTDEIVTAELRQSIEAALVDDDPQLAYRINRLTDFFGKFIRHSGWYPDAVVRLHARDSYQYNNAMVHEKIEVAEHHVKTLDGDMLHYTSDNYYEYMRKSLRYANDWAEEMHARGRRTSIMRLVCSSIWMFIRKYIFQLGFADGKHGFMLAVQSSHYVFNKYFGLWVKQQQASKSVKSGLVVAEVSHNTQQNTA
ncbi:glycosyltransferase family 2 protein [Ferrimonas lipolytica]|uniref:Glycosyltransferase family 2 protein n=2 Tax=Ferrimonas lipolytica TaxID=2724191 RepID=A0A6H1UJZ7_9GAMM|nr:glycosyltransferase family 2 protein [Ferrimonas lipolytica]